ncbi:hypothetical protein BL250_01380 [Erwinia sp. OLTSP20]|uniref:DUF4396 domain-containing protein n=1 Tax=unclassified Erwinia TaxID=2622719 RepID=UPI000C193582|nr:MULTISPECIES: DUF4396 domain-containing protein [unclassified Erwinia]PIJ51375.1 hypothetical protein BV501_04920 [Erwinia sp. OAMSP11]PIJ74159.1 hypothetical protein BK416_05205 [Erwinia sp. OLSSP12]PIJ81551.1 hypothetical protein BLD47_08440 [Erwinia sp. OLCASP19]PIJ86122.1 hypothetical protein BLD46_05000 [Erwinia sp. OLMTSP26]PIJ87870.1 hypothetical protein BLD49_05000 [Erwinia sp. OLMDSP33]
MLDKVAMLFLLLGVCTALMIVKDALRRPGVSPLITIAWTIGGFYMPFIGWLAWWHFGRTRNSRTVLYPHRPDLRRATPAGVFISTSLTASGCVAGAMLALALLPLFSQVMPDSPRLCHAIFSSLLSLLIGCIMQILYRRQSHQLCWVPAGIALIKNDLLSIIAWQAGMFLYLELAVHFLLQDTLWPNQLACWFMLQIAFFSGFVFAWPVNKTHLEKGHHPSA